MSKLCNKCKREQDTTLFYKDKSKTDGLTLYCRECCLVRNNKYNKENRERMRENSKRYSRENREKMLETSRKWSVDNSERYLRYHKEYRETHKENMRIWRRNYDRKKREENPMERVYSNISRRIRWCIEKGGNTTQKILGYSIRELKGHLESQFDEHMSWDNYGSYWHIDHIIPVSSFSYTNYQDEDFKRCWDLSNLQPLEAIENIKKSNKLLYNKTWQH